MVLLSPAKDLQLSTINTQDKHDSGWRVICCCPIQKADRIAVTEQQTVMLLWVQAAAAQHVGAQDQFKSGHKIPFIKLTF